MPPRTKASDTEEGGIGIFGFCAKNFGFCAKNFGFCAKNFGFSVCCSFRFADFTRFSIWFSVFVKNINKFFSGLSSERQLSASTDLEQPRNGLLRRIVIVNCYCYCGILIK